MCLNKVLKKRNKMPEEKGEKGKKIRKIVIKT